MSIYKQFKIDTIVAMKELNNDKRDLLRVVIGEFDRVGSDISDEDAMKIIRKMYINACDLKNDKEAEILETYLPKMLEPKEIRIIIERTIEYNDFSGIKDMGKVMSILKGVKEAAQIDMFTASQITKEIMAKEILNG